jgi:hypothetical protein
MDDKVEELLNEKVLKFWSKVLEVSKLYHFFRAFHKIEFKNSELFSELNDDHIYWVFDEIHFRFRDLIYLNLDMIYKEGYLEITKVINNPNYKISTEYASVINKWWIEKKREIIEKVKNVRDKTVAHNDKEQPKFSEMCSYIEMFELIETYKCLLNELSDLLWITLVDFEEREKYQYDSVERFLEPLISSVNYDK